MDQAHSLAANPGAGSTGYLWIYEDTWEASY